MRRGPWTSAGIFSERGGPRLKPPGRTFFAMEFQKEFTHTAFGGFKREEVTSYLRQLEQDCTNEIDELNNQLSQSNTQIAELKSIIETQYQKIVSGAKDGEELRATLKKLRDTCSERDKENRLLKERLTPFEEAAQSADEILSNAVRKAEEVTAQAEAKSRRSMEQGDRYLEELRRQADALLSQASEQAKALMSRAQDSAEALTAETERKTREAASRV